MFPLECMLDIYKEFNFVGLLQMEYRVKQLKLGHMFIVINGSAPDYMKNKLEMARHNYSARSTQVIYVKVGTTCK